jgi:hypothetical protein
MKPTTAFGRSSDGRPPTLHVANVPRDDMAVLDADPLGGHDASEQLPHGQSPSGGSGTIFLPTAMGANFGDTVLISHPFKMAVRAGAVVWLAPKKTR